MADEEKQGLGAWFNLEKERRTIDQAKIDLWLRTKGKGDSLIGCPMCGTVRWAYWPYVFRSMQKPYASPDFVEVSCQHCGFMARFDMDIVDPDFSRGSHGGPK